jgi:mannitol/fructose-specific phosphotransferase system IIA component (Ntr-type)
MHPVVNHLIQLQELTLVRDEQRMSDRDKHLEQLNTSIKSMADELPSDLRTQFEKLQKRDVIAVAPLVGANCAVCGIKLSTSLAQQVRNTKELFNCPNCARILYADELAPRRVGQRTRRTGPRKVGISRFSADALMLPNMTATDTDSAIDELTQKMETEGFVSHADRLTELALRREAICSTAIEHGLAFPHIRGVEGGGLTLALGTSQEGIQFDEGAPLTHIIFLIVIPTAASAFYMRLLSGLTKAFTKEASREAIMTASNAEEMWKALSRVTRTAVK